MQPDRPPGDRRPAERGARGRYYHIMLIGLKQDLKVGDSIEITLKFENVGEIKVTAAVRES